MGPFEFNTMAAHSTFTVAREIMLRAKPDHSSFPSELNLVRSALYDLDTYAKNTAKNATTALCIASCYEHWMEIFAIRIVNPDESASCPRSFKASEFNSETRKLMEGFWTFNYTFIAVLTLLDM